MLVPKWQASTWRGWILTDCLLFSLTLPGVSGIGLLLASREETLTTYKASLQAYGSRPAPRQIVKMARGCDANPKRGLHGSTIQDSSLRAIQRSECVHCAPDAPRSVRLWQWACWVTIGNADTNPLTDVEPRLVMNAKINNLSPAVVMRCGRLHKPIQSAGCLVFPAFHYGLMSIKIYSK